MLNAQLDDVGARMVSRVLHKLECLRFLLVFAYDLAVPWEVLSFQQHSCTVCVLMHAWCLYSHTKQVVAGLICFVTSVVTDVTL